MSLLTETADYDVDGSWGPASNGWPGIHGDDAYAMYVFANCVKSIPYGSYVLMAERGKYGSKESYLRVHPGHIEQLKADYEMAGHPTPEQSVDRRNTYGRLNETGNREAAPRWW